MDCDSGATARTDGGACACARAVAAHYHDVLLDSVEGPMRTLITNGTVVNADGSFTADVLIEDDTIAAVGVRHETSAGQAPGALAQVAADRTIDARGRLVIPGGIDVHTHMELPFGGTAAKDTFETGTRAAAFGGTTSIIDFAVQTQGQSLREGLDAWHARAEGHAAIDYGFHMIMSDVNEATLKEMDQLVAEGVTDFKLFTAYPGVFFSDDGAIFRAMQRTASNGGTILMHAENGLAIDELAADAVAAGDTDPYHHGVVRKPIFEGEATNRVIRLAESLEVPVYIVHLSARDALEELVRARDRGAMAFAETCPQYLFLSLEDMRGGFEGAKYVCSPPLRPADHQEDLWRGLIRDDLQVVATDHCPFDFEGQKELGRGDIRKVPNGLPGVEDRLDHMHDGGVVSGRLSRERWVEVCSAAPARMFGLAGVKGVIAPGADADIVIYDPERRHVISASTHHMNVDYSVYEGREVQGGSDIVLSRGRVIVEDGEYTGAKGDGAFLRRAVAREYLR
jgi:dihydropyrimidinase